MTLLDNAYRELRDHPAFQVAENHAFRGVRTQVPLSTRVPDAQTVAAYGIDFAWTRYDGSAARRLGARFACSYLSNDPSKNWYRGLIDSYHALGLSVVPVWETTAERALGGYGAGQADAYAAGQLMAALGWPASRPCYFAVDFDETPGQAGIVAAYFAGVNRELGVARSGGYGGIWVVKRLFDAGLIRWGWQTYAWSGGQWDPRAQLQQYLNGQTFDWNRAMAPDFGQYGPGGSPQPPPPPGVAWPVVGAHATGRDVRALQYLLGVTVDGICGPQTMAAVRGFQAAHGLPADGICGPQTWPKLVPLVKTGSTGNAVKAVQEELNARNYGLAVDGAFGPNTDRAVHAFQVAHKLGVDGIVGPQTWLFLLGA